MILVLGGTSDSLEICKELNKYKDIEYTLSVTTKYGKEIAKRYAKNIILGKLSKGDMLSFINENDINKIIDVTHPYAVEISNNAIECSKITNIDYIRFERKSLIEEIDYENKYIVDSIDEACSIANRIGKNIFIGTGSKNLDQYIDKMTDKNIVARVLPTSEVISNCEKLGLNGDNIIAMKGPFSQSMNEEIYKQYKIDLVITKESGVAGGFLEKVIACKVLNIPVIIIKRTLINYPTVINDTEEIKNII